MATPGPIGITRSRAGAPARIHPDASDDSTLLGKAAAIGPARKHAMMAIPSGSPFGRAVLLPYISPGALQYVTPQVSRRFKGSTHHLGGQRKL